MRNRSPSEPAEFDGEPETRTRGRQPFSKTRAGRDRRSERRRVRSGKSGI